MKSSLLTCFFVLVAMILMPVAALDLSEFSVGNVSNAVKSDKVAVAVDDEEDVVKVMAKASGDIMKTSVVEYLIGCVACEMPATYHEEALKAQAVAAYTNLVRLRNKPDSTLNGADISDDPQKHQGYYNEQQQREKWGDKYERYHEKLQKAVSEVAGQAIVYDDEPIVAAYCAICSGKTENAAEVWGTELPYLTSVVSSGDKLSPNYTSTVVLTKEQFINAASTETGINLGDDPTSWITNIERTQAGSVKSISLGGKQISGARARTLFSLRSPDFTVEYENDGFTFNVSGYGHLLGMSQYGADYMARNGSSYKDILSHYYSGTQLKRIEIK